MNEREIKRQKLLTEMLGGAAESIRATPLFAECKRLIEINEFELVLIALEEEGRRLRLSFEFWDVLKKSADLLGLPERAKELQRRRYQSRVAAQPSAAVDGFATP